MCLYRPNDPPYFWPAVVLTMGSTLEEFQAFDEWKGETTVLNHPFRFDLTAIP
jgi:hypothetical protein